MVKLTARFALATTTNSTRTGIAGTEICLAPVIEAAEVALATAHEAGDEQSVYVLAGVLGLLMATGPDRHIPRTH